MGKVEYSLLRRQTIGITELGRLYLEYLVSKANDKGKYFKPTVNSQF